MNYNYEGVLQTFVAYGWQNVCSGFDGGYTAPGKASVYRALYAVQTKVPFMMCMLKKTISINNLDEIKYRRMRDIHLALAPLNKSADPCFNCYELFKKAAMLPHCHFISGRTPSYPLPITEELIIIHDFGVPGFLECFYEILNNICNEEDDGYEAAHTHRGYLNEKRQNAYRRVGCGFTTRSTASTYLVNNSLDLAYRSDIKRRIADDNLYWLMDDDEPMNEYFRQVARL